MAARRLIIATTKSNSIRVKPVFGLLTLDGTLIPGGHVFKGIDCPDYSKVFSSVTSFFWESAYPRLAMGLSRKAACRHPPLGKPRFDPMFQTSACEFPRPESCTPEQRSCGFRGPDLRTQFEPHPSSHPPQCLSDPRL